MTKTILFHRNYQAFYGGHLKVFDYFRHTQAADGYHSRIYVTPDSRPDHLWCEEVDLAQEYRPMEVDALFIAGMDWQALDAFPEIEERIPVINLIQHVRHASPDQPLFRFLNRRATRICVSSEVADALKSVGICNGPIYTIPNGIDRSLVPFVSMEPEWDVFISGYKRPGLAQDVAGRLERLGLSVDCLTKPVKRPDFLKRMSRARLVILLPHETEGFYLPALEAMVMGCVVICPDCIGNRSFCIPDVTALVPAHEAAAIEAEVVRLQRSPALEAALRRAASMVSMKFDIGAERAAYHRILRKAIR